MNHISIKKFGFAVGATIVIIYIGCILVTSFITSLLIVLPGIL